MPNMAASKQREAAAATLMFRKLVFFMFISPKARSELHCPISAPGLQRRHERMTQRGLSAQDFWASATTVSFGPVQRRPVSSGVTPTQ